MRFKVKRQNPLAPRNILGAMREISPEDVDRAKLFTELSIPDNAGGFRQLWEETGRGTILVPRNYSVPWSGSIPPVSDIRSVGPCSFNEPHFLVSSKATIRENQKASVQALLSSYNDKILSLGCGRGKTVIALHSACTSGRLPCLIVVGNTELYKQWVDRIVEHTSCPRERIGRIQGEVMDILDKPFVVAILNTTSMRELPQWVYRYFVLVIFDEAHILAAGVLGRAARLFYGERWSLTATPERDDGLDPMFRPHLGPVVLRDTEHDLTPTVFFVRTGVVIEEGRYQPPYRRFQMAKLWTDLSNHQDRNAMILSYLQRALGKGRTALVVGDRIAQLEWFVDRLGHATAGLLCDARPGEKRVDMVRRRAEALKKRATCAISALAKQGLDRQQFDTVILPIPIAGKGRADQTIGRILRATEGSKQPPVVLAFVDEGVAYQWSRVFGRKVRVPGFLAKITAKMERHIQELGYEVKWQTGVVR